MTYVHKPEPFEACQYKGRDKIDEFHLEGVKLETPEGLGGYSRKLAFITNKKNIVMTVRPKDWVCLIGGDIVIINDEVFSRKYEKLTTRNKAAKRMVEDNLPEYAALDI